MKKLSAFFICFFCLSVQANVFEHSTNLDTVVSKIPKMDSIKCKFKQEKNIVNIQKPIVSSGDFEFRKGEGVYFYTTYPIKSTTNYTNKNYKEVNNVISAISAKKYSKLEKDFDFYFTEKGSNWILGLKPKDKSTAVYLDNIQIEGSDYINKIKIVQTNGNKTTLWFIRED